MRKHLLKVLLFTFTIFCSCSFQTNQNEPINAFTTLESFNPYLVAYKLKKVKPISPEEIYGEWDLIASFFSTTNKDGRKSKTTFGLEGRKYHIKQNGEAVIDNRPFGKDYSIIDSKWKLNSDKTTFQCGGEEPYQIRVNKDTMEWLYKVDIEISKDDYFYFLLVKS
jgi:hypothetical protein